jgi:hypothetical protein
MDKSMRVVDFLDKEADLENVRSVAERFKELVEVQKAIEAQLETLTPILIDQKVLEYFPEDNKKVVMTEGREMSEIDTTGLFDQLFKAGRMWDFVKVASVSQTSLGKLSDGEVLAVKFKKVKGNAAPSVSLKDLSKADRKKLILEGKIKV